MWFCSTYPPTRLRTEYCIVLCNCACLKKLLDFWMELKMLLAALLLALITMVVCVGGTTTCGGNCPGGCNSCPCGNSSHHKSSSSWCSKFSGWKQSSCECIMEAESGGNANAVNMNRDSSYDVGLWQINDFNWKACSGGRAPCSPDANLECAKKVFGYGGNTWKLWSTCTKCGVCHSS